MEILAGCFLGIAAITIMLAYVPNVRQGVGHYLIRLSEQLSHSGRQGYDDFNDAPDSINSGDNGGCDSGSDGGGCGGD